MLSKFTRTAALAALTCSLGALPALAQTPAGMTLSRADEAVLEMGQAFNRADKARLAALLPQTRGHALEPWAAYWELRNRLDLASAAEVQAFFARYAGSYQEDRLRNDWLLLLGQRRDALAEAERAMRGADEARATHERRLEPLRERIGQLRLEEQEARIAEEGFAAQLAEADADIAADAADGAEPDAGGSTAEDMVINQETTDNAGVELAA